MINRGENTSLQTHKKCTICKLPRPTSEFNRDITRADGLQYKCRDCSRKISAPYRVTPAHKDMRRRAQKEYIGRYPEKGEAHRKARIVPLGEKCEDCGMTTKQLHRHHPDYSKPLDVVILCIKCHERVHHG